MIEIPEGIALAAQIDDMFRGRTLKSVTAAVSPHKFAWYEGDPAGYGVKFSGRTLTRAHSYGGKVHIDMSGGAKLIFGGGIVFRYLEPGAVLPDKHQLCIGFEDGSHLTARVHMYGSIRGYNGECLNYYDETAHSCPSPLSDDFTPEYFALLRSSASDNKRMSVKAFLATDQRIPGLGNGVLQDILFDAGIAPKRDISALTDGDFEALYRSVRRVLEIITVRGGRDTEGDIHGRPGGYKTLLSRKTRTAPCPRCGGPIKHELFLGGSVYYCAACQH